jgi:CelD/BcsL family acetyltransferase involved in cellulose biosynthesis
MTSATIRTYSLEEATAELGERWANLVCNARLNPSLHPAWLAATIRGLGASGTVRVVAMLEGDELLGILPLQCYRQRFFGVPLNVVAPCSNIMSYHAEIAAPAAGEQLLLAALEHAHGGRWDVLTFQNVPDESATAKAIQAVTRAQRLRSIALHGERSPRMSLSCGWEELLKKRSKKLRANVTRAVRKMKESGETAMTWYVERETAAELLAHILEVEALSWKHEAGKAISSSSAENNYHAHLLPALADLGALFANVLFVNHKPRAYVLCCRYNGWVGQLKTSFDRSLPDAGARVVDESIRRAAADGAATYDFLGDVAPHKMRWADEVIGHSAFWVFSRRPAAHAIGLVKTLGSRAKSLAARPKMSDVSREE